MTADKKERPPARTIAERENQLINLSVDLAEKQLSDGSATSQVMTHFLRLGTVRAQVELEKLKRENRLLEAKTDALESAKRIEELYKDAISAFRTYQGIDDEVEDEDI